MTRKEKIDLILSKVPEDKKDALIADLREAKSGEDRVAVLKKYGASFTKEELKAFQESKSNAVPDEELDEAAGGCCSCKMPCPGSCSPYCSCV